MKLSLLLLWALVASAGDLPSMAARFAPVLHLHPGEKIQPVDPAEYYRAANLPPGADEISLPAFRAGGTPAPWVWVHGSSPLLGLLPPEERWELLEYWYFLPRNETGLMFHLGDHEGDWEGVALLFAGKRPVAAYYSQHEGGEWSCANRLEWENGRPVVYSALGTHASFPHAGIYPRPYLLFGQDEARRGPAFALTARPLEAEPYFDFTGRWGKSSWLPSSSGPFAPHPGRKFLPRAVSPGTAKWIIKNCLSG